MRLVLVFLLILAIAGVGGFFYLVHQADVTAPAAHSAEVDVDVDLSR